MMSLLPTVRPFQQFFKWRPDDAGREPMNVFSPRSDPESEDPFIPDHPFKLMDSGVIQPVPYMLGTYCKQSEICRINSCKEGNVINMH